jgi:amino acid transporter
MQENKIDTSSEKPRHNITYAKPAKFNLKDLLKISSFPVFIASLCCLSPIILLSLGLVTLSTATELADVFYGAYKWVFRAVGLAALITAFVFYMRRQGVCTIDEVKRRRNEILNKLALALIVGVLGYIFFLYVVVHYIGVFLNVWK